MVDGLFFFLVLSLILWVTDQNVVLWIDQSLEEGSWGSQPVFLIQFLGLVALVLGGIGIWTSMGRLGSFGDRRKGGTRQFLGRVSLLQDGFDNSTF